MSDIKKRIQEKLKKNQGDDNGSGESWYHGTNVTKIDSFHPNSYFTSNRDHAADYARSKGKSTDPQTVIEAKLHVKKTHHTSDFMEIAHPKPGHFEDLKSKGYDSVRYSNQPKPGEEFQPHKHGDIMVVFHPQHVEQVSTTSNLEKGIKEMAAATLVGAAAMAPNAVAPAQGMAATHSNVAVTKPHVAPKIELHPDLQHIAMNESSGGKNKNHAQTTVGLNAGHTAGGSTGLMPITIQEAVRKNPDLTKKYGHLLNMDHKKVTFAINNDPNMENDIANHHWNRLGEVFHGNKPKMAYAWRKGIKAAADADEDTIHSHPYVQKFMEQQASRQIASQMNKSEELEKIMTVGHVAGGEGLTGGAALMAESIDKVKKKLKKGKMKEVLLDEDDHIVHPPRIPEKSSIQKHLEELEEIEALVKAAANDYSEVASVAVRNGSKLLMGARRDNDRWTLPGGHLNEGEEKHEGAARELFEESGIQANPNDLKYLGSEDVTTFSGKKKKIHAYLYDHQGETPNTKNDPDKEVHQWHWIDTSKGLPDHIHSNLHSPKNLVLQKLGLQPLEKSEELEKVAQVDWNKYGISHHQDKHGIHHVSVHLRETANSPPKSIGEFQFVDDHPANPGKLTPMLSEVEPEHRRKGIASAAYDYVEEKTGLKVAPATSQTNDAKKLWASRLDKSEDLEKMSRPMIGFPNFKKLSTRPDQEVQPIETGRQKEIYGRKVANAEFGNQEVTRPTRLHGSSKRLNNKTELVDAYSKRVASKFDRNTLGLNHDTQHGPKAAAIQGKMRSKFEEGDSDHQAKLQAHADKVKAMRADHQKKMGEWREKGYQIMNNGTDEDYKNHQITRPKEPSYPRKPAKPRVSTTDLSPEKAADRGRAVDGTIHHEALHLTLDQMDKHYGAPVVNHVKKEMLKKFPQDTLQSVGEFIAKRGYKPSSAHFTEELLTHARDIITNPAKREAYKKHAGEKADQHIKALKAGHQAAYEYAKNLKPEDVPGAPVKKTETDVKDRLKKAIDRNSILSVEISIVDEDLATLEKAERPPRYKGEIHPEKGYVADHHPRTNELQWTSAPDSAKRHDFHINRPELRQGLLNRVSSPEHKRVLSALMDHVAKDPARHFIPTGEGGTQRLRARHLKALLQNDDNVSMDTSDPNRLKVTLNERHGSKTGPTSFVYSVKKKG